MKYFLGEAANYDKKAIFRQLFTHAGKSSSTALKTTLATRYGAPEDRVALYSNGRSALAAAIKALVPRGSQVIVNGFTCQAVVEAVRAANCTPVYADINPITLHFDAQTLAATLKKYPRAQAIIVQNTLGIPADATDTYGQPSLQIPRLFSFARRHRLIVIEDLAHCASRFYKSGIECGQLGAATVLSFGKGKAIDTINGGALILRADTGPNGAKLRPLAAPTDAPRLRDSLRARFYPLFGATARALTPSIFAKIWLASLLKLHLIQRSADAELSLTRRLTHWQAKLALAQLTQLPTDPANSHPLRDFRLVSDRPAALAALAQHGYYLGESWYECPISPLRNYAKWQFPESECPVATRISRQIINIPTIYGEQAMRPALKILAQYAITSEAPAQPVTHSASASPTAHSASATHQSLNHRGAAK